MFIRNLQKLFISPCGKDSTLEYAASELTRILALCGCTVETEKISCSHPAIMLGDPSETELPEIRFDGFRLIVKGDSAAIEAQIENSESAAKEACAFLEKNLRSIENAAAKCRAAGYPDSWLHLNMRIPMERREAETKLKQYGKFKKL